MQHKTGGHHFEGVFLTKPCWQLAGQINCKLQQGMKKPLKPLQFQGFLVAAAGLEPATSGL